MSRSYRTELSAEYVRSRLSYDPASGDLLWKHRACAAPNWNSRCAGKRAGAVADGYIIVRLENFSYRAHRLIWLIAHGEWPPQLIDHKNGDKQDNRLSNLRIATHAQNMQNVGAKRTAATKLKGVRSEGRRFIARIHFDGSRRYLGIFDTAEAAHAAYCAEASRLHGQFFNPGHRS